MGLVCLDIPLSLFLTFDPLLMSFSGPDLDSSLILTLTIKLQLIVLALETEISLLFSGQVNGTVFGQSLEAVTVTHTI